MFCSSVVSLEKVSVLAFLTMMCFVIVNTLGTGKTYVAQRILRLLLTSSNLPEGPIVIITQKNHALDQVCNLSITSLQ